MTLHVAASMLDVQPEDYATRMWLRAIPLHLFAEVGALTNTFREHLATRHVRTNEPPTIIAAEYRDALARVFPDEEIAVRAALEPRP
jgi:hypothetical protein